MKKIECIIKREKLQTAVEALKLAGVPGMTITEVMGFGKERVIPEPELKPKVKIEIYLDDDEVDTIVKALTIVGRTGKIGDGKIATISVDELIRVRTGEIGNEALY